MDKLASIDARITKVKEEILALDYVLRGSINKNYMKCGKKECICHKDPSRLHGPYYYFTRKVKGKTKGRMVHADEAAFLLPYARKYNYLSELVRTFSELSEKALPILLARQMKAGR